MLRCPFPVKIWGFILYYTIYYMLILTKNADFLKNNLDKYCKFK